MKSTTAVVVSALALMLLLSVAMLPEATIAAPVPAPVGQGAQVAEVLNRVRRESETVCVRHCFELESNR